MQIRRNEAPCVVYANERALRLGRRAKKKKETAEKWTHRSAGPTRVPPRFIERSKLITRRPRRQTRLETQRARQT